MNALFITHPNTTGPSTELPTYVIIMFSHLWYFVNLETFSITSFFRLIIMKIHLSGKGDRKRVVQLLVFVVELLPGPHKG